jgi:TonB-linked SusC/RagA family outer membrane protein
MNVKMFKKKALRTIIIAVSILCSTFSLYAQKNITGTVTDVYDQPVIGANVSVKGTTNGTMTDANGTYRLSVNENDVLVFSFVGYVTQEVTVTNQTTVSVKLLEDFQSMEEVVVVGYGTIRKSDMTGAVSSVKSSQFEEHRGIVSLTDVLQGRASGLQITKGAAEPGGSVRMRIRGANSILGNNSPLIVIDGFIGADYNLLNPNDVESVEILKDASSTAIYGSRGSNGVILVTTKKGSKTGKVTVDYKGSVLASTIIKPFDLLSPGEYVRHVIAQDKERGIANPQFVDSDIAKYEASGYDAVDAIFRTGVSTQQELAISGGTEKTQYRISGNYLNEQGIVIETGYKRYTVRANINTQVNDKLSFRFNVNGASSSKFGNSPIQSALVWSPTQQPYDAEGNYIRTSIGSVGGSNPLAEIYDRERINEGLLANLLGGVNYEIIDGLAVDFQAATNIALSKTKTYAGSFISGNNPEASLSNGKSVGIQTTTQLSYNKTFNDIHRINAVAVVETSESTYESANMSAKGLKFPHLKYYNLAQNESYSISTGYSKSTLLSYLARVNYSLMDKYLLTLAVRRDGSSKFAKKNRFSTFPTVALAWNAKNESFLKDIDWLSGLKIRASYGSTGSQAIDAYATQSGYDNTIYSFTTSSQTAGIKLKAPGNSDLRWETTVQQDIGLEASFMKGRLSFEFDYYVKNTRDLLLAKRVPDYIGGGNITSNIGEVQNNGWDLSLTAIPVSTKDVYWESSFNISGVRNEVVDLGDETEIFINTNIVGAGGFAPFVYAVGESLGSFSGLQYLGPWQKGQEAEAARYGNVPGDARYADLDNNYVIDGNDCTIIGNGFPKVTLGWNNTVNVKNFTINAFFQGIIGFDKMDYTRAVNLGSDGTFVDYSRFAEINDRYIPGQQEGAYLPNFLSLSNGTYYQSTLFLENASYLRLKNLSVGYNFNIKNVKMKVSVSAMNLFTITGYKGIDPEVSSYGAGTGENNSDTRQNTDYSTYPNAKAYILGVNITF